MILKFLTYAKNKFSKPLVQRLQQAADNPASLSRDDIIATRRVLAVEYLGEFTAHFDKDGMLHHNGFIFSNEHELAMYIKDKLER